MRLFNRLLILSILAAGVPVGVRAQVSVNQNALDNLTTPAAPAPSHPPAHRPPPARRPAHPATPVRPGAARPASARPVPAKPATPAPLPPVPPAPPPAVVIPPPVVVPIPPPAPPPPVPVSPTAPGSASDVSGGLRITFGPGATDLNPATQAALVGIAQKAKAAPGAPVTLLAHAAEITDDPSTPRRLSLTRALVARAVLISQGIESTRIYVRALGPADLDGGPADRVDVVIGPTPAPAAPAPSASTPATGDAAPPPPPKLPPT